MQTREVSLTRRNFNTISIWLLRMYLAKYKMRMEIHGSFYVVIRNGRHLIYRRRERSAIVAALNYYTDISVSSVG
jgi:hypothetical protein